MKGLGILLGFNFLGLFLQQWAHVPLPGNVIGLVLFTACLFAGIVKLEWVEQSAGFLLRHMLLFFAPVVVGVIEFRGLLRTQWLPITSGIVGSFLVVLLITGWTAKGLMRSDEKDR
jgi:holin-like protein